MQMRGEIARCLDEQVSESVVDLGGFDGRETEANLGNSIDERLKQPAQGVLTPGASPGKTKSRLWMVLSWVTKNRLWMVLSWIIPGLAPGVSKPVLPVRPDMHTRDHNLCVMLGELPGLVY